ncbi:MAG: glycosyltransferase family 2 protein [Alphaproteobacteria bacterium]|nr:glycosyltransferase family 2 protein [Alphaproteobacteria bacterium]
MVVPAYNEEPRLPDTLPTMLDFLRYRPYGWELRVVDDGSEDGTREVVQAFAAEHPQVVLQAEPHRGKGGAVRAGMLASEAEYRFICDADLSMPVEQIERFLPPRRGPYEVAIASREIQGARRIGEPPSRHLMGRVFNRLVQSLIIPGIEDTQCGFKMFTGEAADALFPRQTIDGWAFDVEILFLAYLMGFRIIEVPVDWYYMERSQIRPFTDAKRMVEEILHIRANHFKGLYDEVKRR